MSLDELEIGSLMLSAGMKTPLALDWESTGTLTLLGSQE